MITIKRYANRKLYNPETRQYVTLDDIAALIQQGQDIEVVDHQSGADLTTLTLLQVVIEQEKKIGGRLPQAMLTRLIKVGDNTIQGLKGSFQAFVNPQKHVHNEILRRLQILVSEEKLSEVEGQRVTDLILDARFERHESSTEDTLEEAEIDKVKLASLQEQVARLEKELKSLQNR